MNNTDMATEMKHLGSKVEKLSRRVDELESANICLATEKMNERKEQKRIGELWQNVIENNSAAAQSLVLLWKNNSLAYLGDDKAEDVVEAKRTLEGLYTLISNNRRIQVLETEKEKLEKELKELRRE